MSSCTASAGLPAWAGAGTPSPCCCRTSRPTWTSLRIRKVRRRLALNYGTAPAEHWPQQLHSLTMMGCSTSRTVRQKLCPSTSPEQGT